MDQKDSCVFLRVATNALFMAFSDVHDVCYVQGRWFATFLSWGSLGHLILRAFPRPVRQNLMSRWHLRCSVKSLARPPPVQVCMLPLPVSLLTLQPSMRTKTGEALCMFQGASEEVGLSVMMNSTK